MTHLDPDALVAAIILIPGFCGFIGAGFALVRELRGPRTSKHYRPMSAPKRRAF